ncbi:hypothetical protein niasHT_024208 [Heterodera trifolii]|uniref:Uncharacterized protein n=1 Tax=Heterodera trifolii TaxID=157864 RepID=A0ABD2JLY6_9BILA
MARNEWEEKPRLIGKLAESGNFDRRRRPKLPLPSLRAKASAADVLFVAFRSLPLKPFLKRKVPGVMDHLITTPAHHHVSPLVRSRSRSETRAGTFVGYRRTRSASFTSNSAGGFTLPSYGYGGGFMARSLSRSNSSLSLFGRGLHSSALDRTPPFHNIAVQRPTPHYTDKYPFVRYSYGNIETGLSIKTQTEMKSPNYYGVKDTGTKRWLEGKLNSYNSGIFSRPVSRERSIERPLAPIRSYVKYMPTEDAVDLFKKRCMTVSTLSKYWLQSSGSTSRANISAHRSYGRPSSVSTLTGSYSTRYNAPPTSTSYGVFRPTKYYSRVANSLTAF